MSLFSVWRKVVTRVVVVAMELSYDEGLELMQTKRHYPGLALSPKLREDHDNHEIPKHCDSEPVLLTDRLLNRPVLHIDCQGSTSLINHDTDTSGQTRSWFDSS